MRIFVIPKFNEEKLHKPNMKISQARKKLFQEFIADVTLHGFRFLFTGNHLRRFIWFVITIATTTLSVFLFYQMLKDYAEYKTVTTFSKSYDDMSSVIFPTIDICLFNPISTEKLSKLPGNISPDDFLKAMEDFSKPNGINFTEPNTKAFFDKLKEHNITTYEDLLSLKVNNFDDLTGPTTWAVEETADCVFYDRKCEKDEFKIVANWHNMICLQFNSFNETKSPLKPKSGSYLNGFATYLDIQREKTVDYYYPFQGAVVYVNNYGKPNQVFGENEVVTIKPGEMTLLKLNRKKITLLKKPYESNCDEKEYNLIKKEIDYSRIGCFIDCIANYVYKDCGCVGFDIKNLVNKDIKICTLEQMNCYLSAKEKYKEWKGEDCYSQCPKECSRVEYDIYKSQAKIGSKRVYQRLESLPGWNKERKDTIDYVEHNIIGLHVSFHDYSSLVETALPAVTWTSLFGSIGGSLGLCFGFSLLTGCEFLFFIYDYITIPWRKDIKTAPQKEKITNFQY